MGQFFDVINPYTGKKIRSIQKMTLPEIRKAISRAQSAHKALASLPVYKRTELLLKCSEEILRYKDDLALLMSAEIGRPIKSSRGEILRTSEIFKIAASEVTHIIEGKIIDLGSYLHPPGNNKRLAMLIREPIGVVASITPFNFPCQCHSS